MEPPSFTTLSPATKIEYAYYAYYVISCIMPIHGHCTLMYPGLLYVLVVICRVVSLYYADWVDGLPFGILHHFTSGNSVTERNSYGLGYHNRHL